MMSVSKIAALAGLGVLLCSGLSNSYADDRDHRGDDRRAPARAAPRDARGQFLDNRFDHGHYYPSRGAVVGELPGGYRPYSYHGGRYFFAGGVWYAPRPDGRFIVVGAPVGLYIAALPPFYTTVWFGGVPYYYADDVYYQWRPDQNGYVVADPPGEDSAAATVPPQAAATAAEDFFIYPRNGQTPDQQAADRYECHSWARTQTGFDPTQQAVVCHRINTLSTAPTTSARWAPVLRRVAIASNDLRVQLMRLPHHVMRKLSNSMQ